MIRREQSDGCAVSWQADANADAELKGARQKLLLNGSWLWGTGEIDQPKALGLGDDYQM